MKNSMHLRYVAVLTLCTLLLAACGGSRAAEPAVSSAPAAPAQPMPAAGAPAVMDDVAERAGAKADGQEQGGVAQAPQAPGAQSSFQRMIVKTADLSLQVDDVTKAEAALRARIVELGGYVASMQSSGTDGYTSIQVSFRVPADRFDTALSGAEGLAKKVLSRGISGEDVTEEFVDLESRTRNLEATRDRLLKLLDQATRIDDTLQVNQALTDIQGQIEQAKGRIQYLRQSAAISTINVSLSGVPITPIIAEENDWAALAVARQALSNLLLFGQGIASVAIVLLVWAPVWLPLLIATRWAWTRFGPRQRVAVVAAKTDSAS